MGQYGNQPDFGTIVTTLEEVGLGNQCAPSAIYVGKTVDGNICKLRVIPVGNNGVDVEFSGISEGTFLPIVVTSITSITNIDGSDVLLYR